MKKMILAIVLLMLLIILLVGFVIFEIDRFAKERAIENLAWAKYETGDLVYHIADKEKGKIYGVTFKVSSWDGKRTSDYAYHIEFPSRKLTCKEQDIMPWTKEEE